MATAQKIEFTPTAYITAGIVAVAGQDSSLLVKKDDTSKADGSSVSSASSSSKRVALTSVAPVLAKSTDDVSTDDKQSWIDSMVAMIEEVNAFQAAIAKTQGKQSDVQKTISDAGLTTMRAAFDDQLKKIAELNKEIDEQKNAGFFEKIGMDILGGVGILAAFMFLGPIGGLVAAGLFTAQMTGATNTMVKAVVQGVGIDTPLGRFFTELAFSVTVAAAGGGAQGFFDGALAATAKETASEGATSAASSATETVQ